MQCHEEAIFNEALDISDAAARGNFLDRACQQDKELRQRVERLLTAYTKGKGLEPTIPSEFGLVSTSGEPEMSVATKLGDRIGPYKLMEQVGEGGMGIVYVAQQQRPIRRMVALKLIKPGMDSKQVVARFEAERQALALMQHPHIAKVLDAGTTAAGAPYFVMELVKGMPITEFCNKHKVPLRERLQLFVKVCEAVQHAHQKGIIHRDLKPSNILVELEDVRAVPKVIDFGIAKALQQPLTERTLYTGMSQMVGTPPYMSPEQAELNSLDVDTRSDVYSLGVLLYELLTGVTPFDRETLKRASFDEMRRMIREDEPPCPSRRLSTLENQLDSTINQQRQNDFRLMSKSIRGELDWIVMKTLEKDRSRRYDSARALAADVQAYLEDQAVQACPPTIRYRLGKLARRHRGLVGVAALVLTAIIVSGTLLWSERQKTLAALVGERDQRAEAEQQKLAAQRQQQLAEENAATTTAERNRALINEYNAEIVSGQGDWQLDYLHRLNQKLIRHLPIGDQPDRRGWEWYYLWSVCHPEVRTLYSAGSTTFASWSPGGDYIASSGDIWRAKSGECVRRFSPSNILRKRSAWSPDGRYFAWGMASDDCDIYVWDRERDDLIELRGHTESVWSVGWSPDSRWLVSGGIDRWIRVWDIASRQEIRSIEAANLISIVAVSPDGMWIAACVKNQGIFVWEFVTGELVTQLNIEGHDNSKQLCWHPRGDQLAVSVSDAWYLYRCRDWSVVREQAVERGCQDLAWSPSGSLLNVAVSESVLLWDPAQQEPQFRLKAHTTPIINVDWSPDGTQLVTSDNEGQVKICNLNATVAPTEIRTMQEIESISWRADSGTLLTDQADGQTAAWNAVTGQLDSTRPAISEGRLVWSPDRKQVAHYANPEDAEVKILNGETGRVHSIWKKDWDGLIVGLAWSNDGKMLAIATRQYTEDTGSDWRFAVFDVDNEATISTRNHRGPGNSPISFEMAWSPNNERLAVTALGERGDNGTPIWQGHVYVINVSNGSSLLKHNVGGLRHAALVRSLAWDPAGRRIVAGTDGGLIECIDIHSGDIVFSNHLARTHVNSLAWSPDGKRIVSATDDGSVKLMTADAGIDLLTFELSEPVQQVVWSPNGRRFAAAMQGGQVQVWDATQGYEFAARADRQGELARAYYAARLGETAAERDARLREVLRLAPDTVDCWLLRGDVRATLGEFDEASREFAKALKPELKWSLHACLAHGYALLGAGKLDAYRRHCVSVLDAFEGTKVPSTLGRVARLCALVPSAEINYNDLAKTLQSATAPALASGDISTMLNLAAPLYRDGQFQRSADLLTEAASRLERSGDPSERGWLAHALCFLALAHFQLGHEIQANRELEESIRIAKQLPSNTAWSTFVQQKILETEAQQLTRSRSRVSQLR